MCKFCEGKSLLSSRIEVLNDIIFFDKNDDDVVDIGTIKKWQECIDIDIKIDRGHITLWVGEDVGCLDHSTDKLPINYCPVCGKPIQLNQHNTTNREVVMELTANQQYLIREALRNEWNRMNAHLESLSVDDYERNGHHIQNDIIDIEELMELFGVRF